MDNTRQILHHTKGVILQNLAFETGSIAQSISTLHQSTLYGFSDPRFVSMLGGLLYLCCRFDESEKVFAETTKRQFSNVNITYFRPHDCGIPGEYDATVRYVGVGYSLVSTDTFTNVRCGSSKYNDILFRVGTQLKVSIEFTARQPVARIIDIIKP